MTSGRCVSNFHRTRDITAASSQCLELDTFNSRRSRLLGELSDLSADDFRADEVEPDDFRDLALFEVAVNRVSDLVMKIGQAVGLGEDRLSEGASGETSLGGLLDEKDHFRQISVLGS
jgi:hypothetical protein